MVSGTVGIAATATDAKSGVAKVEFRVDGKLIGSDSSAPYGKAWNSRGSAAGRHEIWATAYDCAGNAATATRLVTIGSASAPTVRISSPQNNATVSGSIPLTADAADAGSGIAKVEFYVDGALIGKDTSFPYERIWNTSVSTPGTHTVEARAYNRAGVTAVDVITVAVTRSPEPLTVTSLADTAVEPTLWASTSLTPSASREKVPAGTRIRLNARLSADSRAAPAQSAVTVWRKTRNTWSYLGVATYDDAAASFSFPVTPRGRSAYWFFYGGGDRHQAAGSQAIAVTTYPKTGRPALARSPRSRAGVAVKLTGRWSRQSPHKLTVVVYQKTSDGWAARRTVSATVRRASATSGTYSARFRVNKPGAWKAIVMPNRTAPRDACSPPVYFRLR